jgi:hypothetical protein
MAAWRWRAKARSGTCFGVEDVKIVSMAVFCGLILLSASGTSRAAESVSPPDSGPEYLPRAADCVEAATEISWFQGPFSDSATSQSCAEARCFSNRNSCYWLWGMSLSAILTRAAKESALILRMMCPR